MRVFDSGRDANQRLANAQAGPALGAEFEVDRRGHRDGQGAVVPQIGRRDDDLQLAEYVETVDPVLQFEGKDAAVAAEQRTGALVLRVSAQSGVIDAFDLRVRGKKLGKLLRVAAGALHAQGQRFGADGQVVRRFGRECRAGVAQPFLADLHDTPRLGVALLVEVQDIRIAGPVEEAGVGHGAAQRIAVAADVLGQRIDDQAGADALRQEEEGSGDGVIDDIDDAARLAQRSDGCQIGHLCARVGNRLDEDHARFRPQGRFDIGGIGSIDEGHVDPHPGEAFEQAGGVAEQEAAGHQMVPGAEQRKQCCRDGGHAAAEPDGQDALLHAGDFFLQRRRGRRALATIDKTGLVALEHPDQIVRVGKTERGRVVHRFMDSAVFNGLGTVAMQGGGGESVFLHDGCMCRCGNGAVSVLCP